MSNFKRDTLDIYYTDKKVTFSEKVKEIEVFDAFEAYYKYIICKKCVYLYSESKMCYEYIDSDDLPSLIEDVITSEDFRKIPLNLLTKKLHDRLITRIEYKINEIPRYDDVILCKNGVVSIKKKKFVENEENYIFTSVLDFKYYPEPNKKYESVDEIYECSD